jgi:hypothetical protein
LPAFSTLERDLMDPLRGDFSPLDWVDLFVGGLPSNQVKNILSQLETSESIFFNILLNAPN